MHCALEKFRATPLHGAARDESMCNVAHAYKKKRDDGAIIRAMRAVVTWLVLLLAVATFETGRHSVHHLDDDDLAACVVACAATNVPVAEAPPVNVAAVADVVRALTIDVGLPAPSSRALDVHEGRGPPPLLSA